MTYSDIIDLWPSAEQLGDDIGLKWRSYARHFRKRNRIPPQHWPKLLEAAKRRGFPLDEQMLRDAEHARLESMLSTNIQKYRLPTCVVT